MSERLAWTNFNIANTEKGSNYEKIVEADLLASGHTDITPSCGPAMVKPHPTKIQSRGHRVCSVDFYAKNPEGIVEYIEAKGGYTGYVNNQNKETAGARRTEAVSRALWNGWLLKKHIPNSRYVVYFSQEPAPNSPTDIMIQDALEANLVDEVRYLPFYETTY